MDDRQARQEDHQQLLLDYVRGLKKPLLFVARNEYANLGSVKGLDKTVLAVIERALGLNLKPSQKELLREIRLQFLEYDSMAIEERREAIDSTLGYLRTLERQLAGVAAEPAKPPAAAATVPPPSGQKREQRRGRNPEAAGQSNRTQPETQGRRPRAEGKGRHDQGRPEARGPAPDTQPREARRTQHYRESGEANAEAPRESAAPELPVQVPARPPEESRARGEEKASGRSNPVRDTRSERDGRENREARNGSKDSSRNRERDRARLSTAHPRNREGAREAQAASRERGGEASYTELRAERERTRPLAEYRERSDQDLNWGRVRRLPVAQLELVPYIVPELRDDDSSEDIRDEAATSSSSRKQEKSRGKQRYESRGGSDRGPRSNDPHRHPRGEGRGDNRAIEPVRSASDSDLVAAHEHTGEEATDERLAEGDFVVEGNDHFPQPYGAANDEERGGGGDPEVTGSLEEFDHIDDTDDTTIELEVSAVNRLYGRVEESAEEMMTSAYHSEDFEPKVVRAEVGEFDPVLEEAEDSLEDVFESEYDAGNTRDDHMVGEAGLDEAPGQVKSRSGYREPHLPSDVEEDDSEYMAEESEHVADDEFKNDFEEDDDSDSSFADDLSGEVPLVYELDDATDPLGHRLEPGADLSSVVEGRESDSTIATDDVGQRTAASGTESAGSGERNRDVSDARSFAAPEPFEGTDARENRESGPVSEDFGATLASHEGRRAGLELSPDDVLFEYVEEIQAGDFEDDAELEGGASEVGSDEEDGDEEEGNGVSSGMTEEEGRRRGRRRRRRRRGTQREVVVDVVASGVDGRPQIDPAQVELIAARLNSPLAELKGVGPKLGAILEQQGLRTVRDAIHFLPTSYQDRRSIVRIADIKPGQVCIVSGVVDSSELVNDDRVRNLVVQVSDGSAAVKAVWPNVRSNYLKNRFRTGATLLVWGTPEEHDGEVTFVSPETELLGGGDEDESLNSGRIVPIYPGLEGIGQKTIRRMIHQALSLVMGGIPDPVPAPIRSRNRLISVEQALWMVHFPGSDADVSGLTNGTTEAHRALAFQELFVLELALAHRRKLLANESGHAMKILHGKMSRLLKSLPPLTDDQRAVLEDIKRDMGSPHPMMRLLQADVGTGSMQVAALTIGLALDNDSQVAVIAATESMAEQHAAVLRQLLKPLKVEVEVITASIRGRVREKLVHRLRKGEIQVVVGTHALFQDGIAFKKLGLAIIDEQERAGLIQRRSFLRRGVNPDILVLMGVPVPQELLYSIYGDMTWSVLRGQVEERPTIETRVVVNENRDEIENLIRAELARGQQLFYVSPGREEGDKNVVQRVSDIATRLKEEVFPGTSVGYLHNRLSLQEQEEVIQNFRTRQIQIVVTSAEAEARLVSPRASLMIIDRAECQASVHLHFLRGRLLDSYQPAYCFLVPGPDATATELERLHVLEQSQDGFELAEQDYRRRGPVDYLGIRQAGLTKLWVADMVVHSDLLADARREAFRWVDDSPEASDKAVNNALSALIKQRWSGLVEGVPLP